MRKIVLLSLFAFTAIFVSCKKDAPEKNADRLSGQWVLESIAELRYENGVEVERKEKSNLNMNWEFREDGSATVTVNNEAQQFNWVVAESVLTLTDVKNANSKIVMDIKSLGKTELRLEYVQYEQVVDKVTIKKVHEYRLGKR